MVELPHYPPLKSLHPDSSLNAGKLEKLERLSTEALLASLVPGLRDLSENAAGWNYTGWTSSHPHFA
jgi:hypothetical protein